MRAFRWVLLLVVFFLATACGGSSPSAPSSTVTTSAPVVAALSLTGTWMLGNQPAFTITQNGTVITGTQIFSPTPGVNVLITESGTVSGTLSGTTPGSTLTLLLPTTIVSVGTGPLAGFAVTCSSTDRWVGTVTNTSMTGMFTAGAFTCDGVGGPIDVPGTFPLNYTKQ